MSGCFLSLNPLLRRAGNFQAFSWSIGDADTFQIFTSVDQPTGSMVQGTADGFSSVTSAAWRGGWAHSQTVPIQLSLQEQGSFTHGTALQPIIALSHSRACLQRPLYDWNFPRQRKAIRSELWIDIQGLVLILNKRWAIWYNFSLHPLPPKNTWHNPGQVIKKETSSFFCFTTYLTLLLI